MNWRPGKKWLWAAAALIIAIQFIPVERTNPPIESEIPASPEVRAILRKSCYDCHSNETKWPLYARIAPVSWLVAHDVNEGRREMNYSAWNQLTPQKQLKRLRQTRELIDNGEMPMWIYLPLHPEAKLSAEDIALLHEWTHALAADSATTPTLD